MTAIAVGAEAVRSNPNRVPHWRWLRAVQIDAGGPQAARQRDGAKGYEWIRRALRHKRRTERSGNMPGAVYGLLERDSNVFWAHSIWADDRAATRWSIEARILAGETDEEIADKLGTVPGVIEAFEGLFFDVRDKMAHTDYVSAVVLTAAVMRGLQERQHDLLWKLLGYHGGPHVLNAVISKFTKTPRPEGAENVSGFFQDFAVNTMKYKAAVAALTVQTNSHTQMAIIEAFVKYVEIERTTENAAKAQSSIMENIGAMLSSIPFKVGTTIDSETVKVLPFDKNATELRNDELMIINTGGTLPNHQEIQDLRFPENKDAPT